MVSTARTIGVRELKAHTSAVLRQVETSGEEIVITVRGRPVARLEPVAATVGRPTDGRGGLRGALSDLPDLSWDEFEALARTWTPRSLDA